jgi:hypothetical protein
VRLAGDAGASLSGCVVERADAAVSGDLSGVSVVHSGGRGGDSVLPGGESGVLPESASFRDLRVVVVRNGRCDAVPEPEAVAGGGPASVFRVCGVDGVERSRTGCCIAGVLRDRDIERAELVSESVQSGVFDEFAFSAVVPGGTGGDGSGVVRDRDFHGGGVDSRSGGRPAGIRFVARTGGSCGELRIVAGEDAWRERIRFQSRTGRSDDLVREEAFHRSAAGFVSRGRRGRSDRIAQENAGYFPNHRANDVRNQVEPGWRR